MKMPKVINMTGKKCGRLTVLERAENDEHGTSMWLCRCDCENSVLVRGGDLRRKGGTSSCGCLAREISSKRHKTHGKSKTRIYKIWRHILDRCNNPNHVYYKNYGGRGITICDEWKDDFQAFHDWSMTNGYSDNLTIDRINPDGNYEPSNCRWTTVKEQNNNKRNNHMITLNGKTKNVTQWCEELGVNRGVAYRKLKEGISAEEVFNTWKGFEAGAKDFG